MTVKKKNGLREFARYTSLNVLGMIGLSCYILADTFFVSRGLGANGLAALNLAIPVYSFIHGSGLMLGMGGATRYSIFKSQRANDQADSMVTHTVCLAGLAACLFFLMGIFLSPSITTLLGADDKTFAMTETYLRVLLLFAPAFIFNDVLICFVRNDGNPQLSMLAMLGGSMANILLDYLFIFPLQMGIFGAVFATGLAPIISMAILSAHWIRKKHRFHPVRTHLQAKAFRSILSLGFASLVTEVSSGIVIIVFNVILMRLEGNIGVAAYGVVANLSLVVIAIYTGIAQGIQPLISRAYGHGNLLGIRQLLRYTMVTIAGLSAAVYLTVFFCADPIAAVFNSEQNPQLQQIAADGLRLYFTGAVFAGFNIGISVLFTSIEKAVPAHLISLLRGLVIIVPMAFVLSAVLGITGVWLAFPATELLTALFEAVMYPVVQRKSFSKKSVVPEN